MDTATLIAMDLVLRHRSIRAAARALGRPASTVAAAIARFEAEISVGMVERAGPSIVASLEAVRLEPDIAAMAALAREISPRHGIKLDALDRFAQIAHLGSIRRAARAMGLGQPQLSRQVALLETRLGTALLERGSGGSTLTAEGLRIAATTGQLLAGWHRLSRAAEERFRKSVTTARLGSVIPLGYESEIARLLANLAARWLKERPRAPLFVSSTTADHLLAGLKSGLFDVAFLDTAHLPADLEGEVVGRSALAIIGAPHGRAGIAETLLSAPLVVPSPRSGLRQHINRILDDHLDEAQRNSLSMIEIDSIPVILNLVLEHGFVSVLPMASMTRIRDDLRPLKLGPDYEMNFWLCWPRGTGVALGRALIAAMRD